MGLFGKIFGGAGKEAGEAAGETIQGTLEGIGGLANQIRSAFTDDPPPEVQKALAEMESMVAKGQMSINKIEAQHSSVFVAGWRPFVGWTSGLALFYQYLLRPLLPWVLTVFGQGDVPELPELNMQQLVAILTGMLGLSSLRTREKTKGVQNKH